MALRSHDVERGVGELDDVGLVERASAGDADAFEELYRRHVDAAWGLAQAVASNRDDAADAVAEAFTRLLARLGAGTLQPEVPFRPYLLTTTRNAVIDQHRHSARVVPTDEPGDARPFAHDEPGEHAVNVEDAGLMIVAFRTLPERWRSVLWLSEVEGLTPTEVGIVMGVSPTGASQLAHRARVGLRDRYVQAHVRVGGTSGACASTVRQLGAFAAGSLAARATEEVRVHLLECADCRARYDELSDFGMSLRGLPLVLPVGLGAAALAKWHVAVAAAGAAGAAGAGAGAVGAGLGAGAGAGAGAGGVGAGAGAGLGAGARAGAGAAAAGAGGGRRLGVLVGQSASESVFRSLAIGTTAVLALGVITAGLMSSSKGPQPVPNHAGGAVSASPPVVTQLAGSGGGGGPGPGTVTAPGSRRFGSGSGAGVGPNGPGAPEVPKGSGAGHPGAHGGSAGNGGSGGKALVQVTLGTNLDLLNASAAIGVLGGCTGVSLNRSASCAPDAPTGAGLDVGLDSPLGPINIDVPPTAVAAATASHGATISVGKITISL